MFSHASSLNKGSPRLYTVGTFDKYPPCKGHNSNDLATQFMVLYLHKKRRTSTCTHLTCIHCNTHTIHTLHTQSITCNTITGQVEDNGLLPG